MEDKTMNESKEIDVITEAVKHLLKPIVVEVLRESLSEAFLELEKKRRKRYYTRDEVCKLLRIGCTTFSGWQTKDGSLS